MTEDCAVVGTNVVNYVAARNMDTVTYSVVWFRALFLFRKKNISRWQFTISIFMVRGNGIVLNCRRMRGGVRHTDLLP